MILKSLDKNLKHKIRIYQNLIVFSWDSVSFKKKKRKILWNHHRFLFFITMAHTTQNSNKKPTKKPTNYEF